jgi:antitoxin HicB
MNKHLGSNFDDFLEEDGLLAETEAVALKRLLHESREQIALGEVFTAEEVFLESNQIDSLTEAVNQVADQVDTRLEPGLKRLQDATLKRH